MTAICGNPVWDGGYAGGNGGRSRGCTEVGTIMVRGEKDRQKEKKDRKQRTKKIIKRINDTNLFRRGIHMLLQVLNIG